VEGPLERLRGIDSECRRLIHAAAVLQWDQETCMPRLGVEERSEQLALLQGLIHDRQSSLEVGEALDALGVPPAEKDVDGAAALRGLPQRERAFLRELRRGHRRGTQLPRRLVTELARQTAVGQHLWARSREARSFTMFCPQLKRIVELVRETAACLGYSEHPYDPLLDEHEPWTSTAEVQKVFEVLGRGLQDLLQRILGCGRRPNTHFLRRHFQPGAQREFCLQALRAIGYDLDRGRLDESAHPFTITLGGSDVRVTTRFDPHFPGAGIFGALHEGGHALYELGIDESLRGSILAEGTSQGMHASQSRLWEPLVGRSLPCWEHFYPRLRELFPHALSDVSLEEFHGGVNAVAPSMIRVEADEVTYNLHILLRFDMERLLVARQLEVEDLPGAWNEACVGRLGVRPTDDAQGVLQDIHWSMGAIGYFPTYALGNLYAAQLFAAFARDNPDWPAQIRQGRFGSLQGWLREKVHRHGKVFCASELCRRATGSSLEPSHLLEYLNRKFSEVYGL